MGKFEKGKRFGGGRSFGGGRGNFGGGRDRDRSAMHKATCSECGQSCELPFRPTGSRPVFCSSCFDKQGGSNNNASRFGNDRREKSYSDERQMFDTVCSKCHQNCQVPFKPTPGKDVFCDNCFDKGSSNHKGGADYTTQFTELNKKLDKLIDILTVSDKVSLNKEKKIKVEKIKPVKAVKKEVKKEIKKVVKTKAETKKVSVKKKK